MGDVFISYAREDSTFAVGELYKQFDQQRYTAFKQDRPYEVWIDRKDIEPAQDWWQEIRAAIDSADNFVFVISLNSLTSANCHKEISYAREAGKRVIPLLLFKPEDAELDTYWKTSEAQQCEGEINWAYIGTFQWILFVDDDNNRNDFLTTFELLIAAIPEDDNAYRAAHRRYTIRARDWTNKQSPSLLLRGDDLKEAEFWLTIGNRKLSTPTDLHRSYISESRRVEDELLAEEKRKTLLALRLKRLSIVLSGLVLIGIVVIAIAAVLLSQALFRFRLADALRVHTLGSNFYMIFADHEAKAAYEESLQLLNPDAREPWENFTAEVYRNANINISSWFYDLALAQAQLADDNAQSASGYNDALKSLKTAIALDTNFKPAYFAMAVVQVRLDDLVGAQATIDQLENLPGLTDFDRQRITLARQRIAYESDNYTEAIELGSQVEQSTRLWSGIPGFSSYKIGLYFYLAASYHEEGDNVKACRYWDAYRRTLLDGQRIARSIGDHKLYQDAFKLSNEAGCRL